MTDEKFAIRQRNKFFKQNPRCERSIEWFIYAETNEPCDFNDYKLDSKYADRFIKHCPECDVCWQLKISSYRIISSYYEDFPTLGKEDEICPRCSTKIQQD